jgi:rhamnose transport system ATP-binding protein
MQWHIDWAARRHLAAELLDRVGARIDIDAEAGDLTMPEQQLVEIARALGADARIVILDEPTASLSDVDARNLFEVIRQLRSQGVGVIYISHRLGELPEIADRVTVLRDGCTVATRPMTEVTAPDLIHLMVGRELSTVFPKRTVALGDPVLEVRALRCRQNGLQEATFTVRAGEILGVAGLMGAGRTELARTIFGVTPADGGEILVRGVPVTIDNPERAIEAGLAYVPEDRRRHGVMLDMPISTNMSLASLSQFSTRGGLDVRREWAVVLEYVRRLGIKTPSIFTSVGELSGGNQQKVAVSRWLMTDPSVLILDEPTQGVDVGAKSEIHALMVELASRGVAIIMISSDLPEILGMSDRIAVMRGGTVVEIVERADATPAGILALALGHRAPHATWDAAAEVAS